MSLESDMRTYLLAQAAIAALVGTRISPFGKRLQREALPALTYQLVSGPTTHYSHNGASDYDVSFQFDCWASDADGAIALASELQTALDGYRGTWGVHRIGSVFLSTVLDDYEADTGLYRRLRQADIHYSTPAG